MVGAQAHFITPKNLSLFPLGLLANGRVFLLQPIPNLLGILLYGPAHRFLRSKTPAFQISTGGPYRHPNAKLPLNQFGHGFSGPKVKRQLELFRVMIGHRFGNFS